MSISPFSTSSFLSGAVTYLNSSACLSVRSSPFTSVSWSDSFGIEFVAGALRQRAGHLGDLGVVVDGTRIGIGPVDRAR